MKTKFFSVFFAFAPVISLATGFSSSTFAATFDQFVAFGDSTLDSGWWQGALTGACGPVSGPCATGNPTKDAKISAAIAAGGTGAPVGVGLMSTQDLAGYYGLTAKSANQSGGTNYAISGALSARVGTAPGSGNLNPNPNLLSTVEQISSYLANNSNLANAHALYEVGSGGNDRTFANDNFTTLPEKEAFLSGQASLLAQAIKSLQLAGAQTILVRGAQGTTPLANFWTTTLFSDLSALGVTFIAVDIAGLIEHVTSNPTLYGFTAATVVPGVDGPSNMASACVAGPGAVGWGQWCGNTTHANPDFSHLRDANSEQTSFYSDDQHFSAAGQAIVAKYEFDLIESTLATPLPATLPLFATGLGLLEFAAWRRKRMTAHVPG